MPQFSNPSSGYILSANQDPFKVTAKQDNLKAADFAPELGLQTRMTNRAVRGLQLLDEAGTMSAADFRAVKWDKAYARDSRAYRYLDEIQSMQYAAGRQAAAGQKLLAEWSGAAVANDRRGFGRVPAIGGMAGGAGRQAAAAGCRYLSGLP